MQWLRDEIWWVLVGPGTGRTACCRPTDVGAMLAYTEVAEKYFDYVYSRPPFSSRMQLEEGLVNKDGGYTYAVQDFISDNGEED